MTQLLDRKVLRERRAGVQQLLQLSKPKNLPLRSSAEPERHGVAAITSRKRLWL
jgi:hypothetical protein